MRCNYCENLPHCYARSSVCCDRASGWWRPPWKGWGSPGSFPRNLPALVEDAGLRPDGYIERPDWLQRQLRIYRRAATVTAEVPDDPALRDLAEEGHR